MKRFASEDYNYVFNSKNGFFARWGKTEKEDPQYCPYGAEILDLELSTVCSGVNGKVCKFCYKSNTPEGKNMTFDTFKAVLDKMLKPKTLTQVAFGVGDIDANPDLFKIFDYCRSNQIVPNVTVNGDRLTDKIVSDIVKYVGAIAISNYDKDVTYNAVKRFTDAGLKQVNIHAFTSEETYDKIMQLFKDYKTDPRLAKLNAIVLLSLKKKGRGVSYTSLAFDKFKALVDYAFANKIPLGFDSCSCCKFQKCLSKEQLDQYSMLCEPCESSLFSSFVNVNGDFFPCSFMDGAEKWQTGINVATCEDFVKDVWMNERVIEWRKTLLANGRACPVYEI